jgi:hypothetical protein
MTAAVLTPAVPPTEPYDPDKLDTYEYNSHFRWLQRMLWFCAGADTELMKRCPRSEQIKEEGIGGIVLATTVLAFLSGSYAMYIVFGPKVGLVGSAEQEAIHWGALVTAIFVGLIWAAIILNLDRFVVSSTGHGDGTHKISLGEIVNALPRIGMAVLIGLCLSAPLEIKIMESQIEATLRQDQLRHITTAVEKYEADTLKRAIDPLEKDLLATVTRINQLSDQQLKKWAEIERDRNQLKAEAEGKTASGKAGEGPAYRTKVNILAERQEEYAAFKASSEEQIKSLRADQAALEAKMGQKRAERDAFRAEETAKAKNDDGLIKRVGLASEIGGNAYKAVAALLMLIEIAPIFFKMMMARGPYLALVDNQNEMVLARYAISRNASIAPTGNGAEGHGREIYHQPETILEFRVQELAAKRKLSQVAIDEHTRRTEQDIKSNPSRYISEGPVRQPA